MKKVLSLLLAILMIISIVPMNIMVSATDNEITNIHWGNGNDQCTLYWNVYPGARYYLINYGTFRNLTTSTSIDLMSYFFDEGTYTVTVTALDSNKKKITEPSVSPQLNTGKRYCLDCYISETIEEKYYEGYHYIDTITRNVPIERFSLDYDDEYGCIIADDDREYNTETVYYRDNFESFELFTPELEGYDFVGWYDYDTGKTENPIIVSRQTGDKTYVAKFKLKKIAVTFDTQGAGSNIVREYTYGDRLEELPSAERAGYHFCGWYTKNDIQIDYDDDDDYYSDYRIESYTEVPSSNTTYYAIWTPIKYTIQLSFGEETDDERYEDIEYTIRSGSITLPIPTAHEYIFQGWIGEGITTPQKKVVIPKGSIGNKYYNAVWKEDPCADDNHTFTKYDITPATTSNDGKKIPICKNCGIKGKSITIKKIKTVTLLTTKYTYDKTAKEPKVEVKNTSGTKLKLGRDYTVKYKNNKYVGTATATITFMGNYKGTVSRTFTINPKGTTISSIYPESKKITVKWKKQSVQSSGYQLDYVGYAVPAGTKPITIKDNSVTSKAISKLENGADYYVRIRTYKEVGGKKYFSDWSEYTKVFIDKVQLNKTSLSLYRGQIYNLLLKYISADAKIKWKSSDTSVATVSSNGKVTGKGLGKATITATYNGKSYKATVNVTYMKPNMAGLIYNYNTRDNQFSVVIKNFSKKKLTVLSGTTRVEDNDYKTYDRKVKLSKSVDIEPGKTKTVYFDVIGSNTWPDYQDFQIYYKVKIDGKTYDICSDYYFISQYKSGSKWVNTYQSEKEFEKWRPKATGLSDEY